MSNLDQSRGPEQPRDTVVDASRYASTLGKVSFDDMVRLAYHQCITLSAEYTTQQLGGDHGIYTIHERQYAFIHSVQTLYTMIPPDWKDEKWHDFFGADGNGGDDPQSLRVIGTSALVAHRAFGQITQQLLRRKFFQSAELVSLLP